MPWPKYIYKKSARLKDTESIPNRFYGLYCDILREFFPRKHYRIRMQCDSPKALLEGNATPEHIIDFVVEHAKFGIVLFLDISEPLHYKGPVEGDRIFMRERFRELHDVTRAPRLWGARAFGKKILLYSFDTAAENPNDSPEEAGPIPGKVKDSYIIDEEGYENFCQMVHDIHNMADVPEEDRPVHCHDEITTAAQPDLPPVLKVNTNKRKRKIATSSAAVTPK
jgi:hypothetical protein